MATISERLVEARAAYHQLNTGQMARVVVDQNGQRVEFAPANKTALYNYIQQLEGELGTVVPNGIGPARFIF